MFFKSLASKGIYTIVVKFDLLFNALCRKRKKKRKRVYHKVPIGTFCIGCPLIYRYYIYIIFIKP